LVAANGDEVWIDYTGYAPYPILGVPSTIVVDVAFTIVGGTGRFINASGGGEITGYAEFAGVFDLGRGPRTGSGTRRSATDARRPRRVGACLVRLWRD